jgi:protein-S-isoprenylcysteine O-methyltransferase Ste14
VPILKTLLFTILVPGTVAGLVPYLLRGGWPGAGPAWAMMAGGLITAVGVGVYLWCAWDFATFGRGTPAPFDPPRVLVARGLYRYSRNPMYVGVLLAVLGQAAWSRSAALLEYAVLVAAAFQTVVYLMEEPILHRKFGAAYVDYTGHVPRWIGIFRPWNPAVRAETEAASSDNAELADRAVVDRIRSNAELVVRVAREELRQEIGYDEAGVRWLDGYVQRQHEQGDAARRPGLVDTLGAFLGECIVRTHGGAWARADGAWCVRFDEANAAFPFAKVAKQLESGAGDSVLSFFTAIPTLFPHATSAGG